MCVYGGGGVKSPIQYHNALRINMQKGEGVQMACKIAKWKAPNKKQPFSIIKISLSTSAMVPIP